MESVAGLKQNRVDLGRLVARIRAAFPDLEFSHAALNDLGEDHAVVILDQAWVFRFPRSPDVAAFSAAERRLLHRLGQVSSLPTPQYDLVSGDIAGYRMIEGRSLDEAAFAGLSRHVQERIVEQLGGFLACLHALPADLITAPDGATMPARTGAEGARRYVRRRKGIAMALPPDMPPRLDCFFAGLLDGVTTRK